MHALRLRLVSQGCPLSLRKIDLACKTLTHRRGCWGKIPEAIGDCLGSRVERRVGVHLGTLKARHYASVPMSMQASPTQAMLPGSGPMSDTFFMTYELNRADSIYEIYVRRLGGIYNSALQLQQPND